MNDSHSWYSPRVWAGPLVVAAISFALASIALDPGGDLPHWPGGPGTTLDEGYNVDQGVYLVRQMRAYGWGTLAPATLQEIYSEPNHNPDHPPLGRLWLGVAHELGATAFAAKDAGPGWRIVYARFGSAAAFALTVWLVGWVAGCWYGPASGLLASVSLLMMPRAFGHAHIAAIESVLGLLYALAALSVAVFWTRAQPPSKKAAIGCGVLWGLALLTKIQGLLLCVPIGLWALAYWKRKSLVPLMLWGLTGMVAFFAFWPWLWSHPLEHVQKYLGRTTDRAPIKVYYLGTVYTDRKVKELPQYEAVPWHYPLVMFAVTVPLGLLLLGGAGLLVREGGRRIDGRMQVVLGTMLFPPALFCLPGIAVYDGVRLFLVSYPLWAIVVGRGGGAAWHWLCAKTGPFGRLVWTAAFFGAQLVSMFAIHPFLLSYYSSAVGSLRGAAALGFEPTYWGDSIDRDFQQRVAESLPAGSRLGVVPVLDSKQLALMQSQSKIFQARGLRLEPFDPTRANPPEYLLTFFRLADHSEQLKDVLKNSERLAESSRQGILLAAVYRLKTRPAAK